MKKLLDSKFLFILALSIVVLIILGIGAFYLFDDSDAVFVKDGYVLNPLSAKNEKYLFDKNTPYKENLSAMVVFNDTDNKEVSVFKDSFLHYMDSSLSFLSNGAILDLNSISGKDAVKFYNITNKSLIAKNDDGYYIETNGDDIKLKNFMGRISNNKYIVAGNLEAKIPGNEKNISGNYFEIVYNEEGVVTIENSEIKYQVAAEGTYIYAGDIVIDLGNKKIVKNNEDIMSITAITINGDENIEIIPKTSEKDDDDNQNGNENGNGNGTGDGSGSGDGNGQGGNANNDTQEDIKYEELVVSLKKYDVRSTKITATFDVINKREDDNLILKITDLNSGKTIDRIYDIEANKEVSVPGLSPDTKYLLTVVNERDNNKYFQKILKTNKFGIKLEQTYVTSSEIGYKITVDNSSEIEDVDISLLRFDEGNNSYDEEPVVKYRLSELVENVKGEHEIPPFTGLDSNTIYTIALDGFVIDSIGREKIYNITTTALTLKEAPIFGAISREVKDDGFKLFIEDVQDKDNAIENYTYYIFDNETDADTSDFSFDINADPAPVKIVRTTADPLDIKIGDYGIQATHNYIYMISVLYYDNEKYVEYVFDGKIDLFIGNDPVVTIQKGETDYDRISATITITDNSCLIAMTERTCFDDTENYPVQIDVKEKDDKGNLMIVDGYPVNVTDFTVTGNLLKKTVTVTGLKEGTTYVLSVKAKRKDKADEGIKDIKHGAVYEDEIDTKYLASFKTDWHNGESNEDHAVNGTFKMLPSDNSYEISADEAIGLIEKVVFRLYDGPYTTNFANQVLLATSETFVNSDDFSIQDAFYDNEFEITEALFGIDSIDALRELTREKTGKDDNKLSQFYTVMVEAYYANDSRIIFKPMYNSFPVAEYLSSDIKKPTLTAEEIYKTREDNFSSLLTVGENGAVVGYWLNVIYDKPGYDGGGMTIKTIDVHVYDEGGQPVSFYIDDNETSKEVLSIPGSELSGSNLRTPIYIGNGVENGNASEYMVRGKKYYISAEVKYVTSTGSLEKQTTERVGVMAKKEPPKITQLYVAETTKTGDVTYKYKIVDIDNAWRSDGEEYNMYYQIGNGTRKKVAIAKNLNEVNTFKITGLNKGDGYTLTYIRNDYDTGVLEDDVTTVTVGSKNRLYDGYYDAKEASYNFKYRVINDPLHDNKVTVEILATDDIIDKVLIYNVTFTDSKGNSYNVPNGIWKLNKCPWASEDDKNRCFEVPYLKLKAAGMKSEGDEKNYITVSITAIYDNGLMGYDYIDRIGEDKEFPYMIMQDNSTLEKYGDYIIVNNRGLYNLSPFGTRSMPLGYYEFGFSNGIISYYSKYHSGDDFNIPYILGERGYYSVGYGSLNPKMVSVEEMTGEDNEFYFSSITPMIRIDKTISLINGAKVMMSLSGADGDDFCADNSSNTCDLSGDKYLYIQVLDDSSLEVENSGNTIAEPLRPTVKVKLADGDINDQYVTDHQGTNGLINLLHNSKYYYKVYAYLNNGGTKELVEIFNADSKNKPETYTFNSKKLFGKDDTLLASTAVAYQPIDGGNYNDKELVTSINLNPYDSELNIPYIFDVSYEFCKEADCETEGSRLFRKNIDETAKAMTSTQNITSYDIEYGRDYYMYLYMTYDHYVNNNGTWQIEHKTVPVYDTQADAKVPVAALETLKFTVIREANYVSSSAGGYVVDLWVTLKDDDKVLNNGKFYVKLLNSNNEVVGKLMLEEDGNFRQVGETGAYQTYAFEADKTKEDNYINKRIRIGGLEENTSYRIIVYGDAHMKNASASQYDIEVRSGKDGQGDIIWTSNNYGVAFGSIAYRAYEKGFTVRYGNGSNVDALHIQAIEVDVKEDGRAFYNKTFEIGENSKYLEIDKTIGRYRFLIEYDQEGLKNSTEPTYLVTTRYLIVNPVSHELEWLRETDDEYYRAFSQSVVYDPDEIFEED